MPWKRRDTFPLFFVTSQQEPKVSRFGTGHQHTARENILTSPQFLIFLHRRLLLLPWRSSESLCASLFCSPLLRLRLLDPLRKTSKASSSVLERTTRPRRKTTTALRSSSKTLRSSTSTTASMSAGRARKFVCVVFRRDPDVLSHTARFAVALNEFGDLTS